MIEAKNKVECAVNNCLPEIQQLLRLNVNEQTISGVIIKYLIPLFGTLRVDSEYNRHLGASKEITLKEYISEYRKNTNEEKKFNCICKYCKK